MILNKFLETKFSQRAIVLMGCYLLVLITSVLTKNLNNFPTLCPFRLLTGYPCPGCGISRSIGALSVGDFSLSFYFHPLGFFIALIFIIFIIRPSSILGIINNFKSYIWTKSIYIRSILLVTTIVTLWLWNINRFDSVSVNL